MSEDASQSARAIIMPFCMSSGFCSEAARSMKRFLNENDSKKHVNAATAKARIIGQLGARGLCVNSKRNNSGLITNSMTTNRTCETSSDAQMITSI